MNVKSVFVCKNRCLKSTYNASRAMQVSHRFNSLFKYFQCNCYAGYTGKNCEIDIDECASGPCQNNGRCLQRSNTTLYSLSDPQLDVMLPSIFSGEFSHENASGYECGKR